MKQMTKEVTAFKCIWCGEIFKDEMDADQCAFEHARTKLANTLLRKNYSLWAIKYYCGFNWNLSKEQEKITQDNCFKFPHWQGYDNCLGYIKGVIAACCGHGVEEGYTMYEEGD